MEPGERSAPPWRSRWSSWKRPAWRAAFAWWGGAWLPFLFGPLSECGHCVRAYLWTLPVQPGLWVAVALRAERFAFGFVATLMTLALVAGSASLMHGKRWVYVAIPICLLATVLAFGFAAMLRA